MEKMSEFVLMLMHAVTNTHLLHIRASSYAEHVALGDFYPALEELVDELAESSQGLIGEKLQFSPDYYAPMDNGLDELTSLSDYVKSVRQDVLQDSEIQNQIDEIQSLINSTINKLKFYR